MSELGWVRKDAATVGPKTAKRVVTTNPETDGATGRCHCGACGKSIDPSDNFCRKCGARLEN
jgi:predicted amidophosphoribosyltransferase